MTEVRPSGLVAQLKYMIGLALSIIALLGVISGNINEKQVVFSPKEMTTESTNFEFTLTNGSIYPVYNDIFVENVYYLNGEDWETLEFNPEVNAVNKVYVTYPFRYIFPTETYDCSISVESLLGKSTPEAGRYKFVISYEYNSNNSHTKKGTASCEFVIE